MTVLLAAMIRRSHISSEAIKSKKISRKKTKKMLKIETTTRTKRRRTMLAMTTIPATMPMSLPPESISE